MNRIRQRCTALVLLLLLACEMGVALALTPGAAGCCGHCDSVPGLSGVAVACASEQGTANEDPHATGTSPAPAVQAHGAAPCASCGAHCGMSMTPFVFFVDAPAARKEAAFAVATDGAVRLPVLPPSRLEKPPRIALLVA